MARADSLIKLAWAYGVHQARRRIKRPRSQLANLRQTYSQDGIHAFSREERERLPRLVGCINCGLCAFAAGRVGKTRLPDLATSYMRLYAMLGEASSDLDGDSTNLFAATSVCPVGLPLEEVAEAVRRMTIR